MYTVADLFNVVNMAIEQTDGHLLRKTLDLLSLGDIPKERRPDVIDYLDAEVVRMVRTAKMIGDINYIWIALEYINDELILLKSSSIYHRLFQLPFDDDELVFVTKILHMVPLSEIVRDVAEYCYGPDAMPTVLKITDMYKIVHGQVLNAETYADIRQRAIEKNNIVMITFLTDAISEISTYADVPRWIIPTISKNINSPGDIGKAGTGFGTESGTESGVEVNWDIKDRLLKEKLSVEEYIGLVNKTHSPIRQETMEKMFPVFELDLDNLESEIELPPDEQLLEMLSPPEISNEETPIDVDLRKIKDKDDREKIENFISSIASTSDKKRLLVDGVANEILSALSDDINLYKIYGPSNVDVDADLTDTSDPCSRHGGSRMFVCECYTIPDDDGSVNWFSGSCDECLKRIYRKCWAIRKPMIGGDWMGCFCSFDCIRDSIVDSDPPNRAEIPFDVPANVDNSNMEFPLSVLQLKMVDQLEDEMYTNGIYDRDDNDAEYVQSVKSDSYGGHTSLDD
jgi:hypothetical protein